MQNYNYKCEKYIQNMDVGIISTSSIELTKWVNKLDIKKITTKSFYISAPMQLLKVMFPYATN